MKKGSFLRFIVLILFALAVVLYSLIYADVLSASLFCKLVLAIVVGLLGGALWIL